MNQLVELSTKPTDIGVWLGQVAEQVQAHLGKAAHELYQAGYWLGRAKDEIPYGEWEKWVNANFPFSPETARRYVRVSNLLENYISEEHLPKLLVSRTALYELASGETPEDVRVEMMARLEQGQRITLSMVQGAARAAERSEEQRDAILDTGSDAVAFLAETYDLEPAVILMLGTLESDLPDTFDEIYVSGTIEDVTGESVSLQNINTRDLAAFVDNVRFERGKAGLARMGSVKIVLDGVKAVEIKDVWASNVLLKQKNLDLATRQVAEAIEEQFGGLEERITTLCDVVYTCYYKIRQPRASDIWVRGYESGLVTTGILQGDGPLFINSVKVRSRADRRGDRVEIDIYPLRAQ